MQKETTTRPMSCHPQVASRHWLYGASVRELGWVPSPSYLLRRARILDRLRSIAPGKVLEIGCGAGGLISDFLDRGWQCCAVDDSPAALEILHKVYASDPRVQVLGSLTEAAASSPQAVGSAAFDLLVAFEVLEHIEYDRQALSSWLTYLKSDGEVLLSVPAHRKRWNSADEWAGHFRRYDEQDLMELLTDCGLEIVELECYGFPLGNIVEPLRARLKRRSTVTAALENSPPQVVDEQEALAQRTARSGTERTFEMKLYPYLCSPPGICAMQVSFWLQKAFRRTGCGVGFFVRARRSAVR